MKIEEFTSKTGECVYVEFNQSEQNGGTSLGSYHPNKHLGLEKYKAFLALKDKETIKMELIGRWNDEIKNLVADMEFVLMNKSLVTKNVPNFIKSGWKLTEWKIKKNDDPIVLDRKVIQDTLSWESTINLPKITTSWTWIYNP